jgi:hypothetical protein
MNYRNVSWQVTLAGSVALATISEAGDQTLQQALENLQSRNATMQAESRRVLGDARSVVIENLFALARSEPEQRHLMNAKLDAIRLLGEYRAKEAVEILVEQIEYSPPIIAVYGDRSPVSAFPSAVALLEIGEPAVRHMLFWGSMKPRTQRQLELFADVIWLHYAREHEQEIGLLRLQRLRERANGQWKQNLDSLVEIYRETGPRNVGKYRPSASQQKPAVPPVSEPERNP